MCVKHVRAKALAANSLPIALLASLVAVLGFTNSAIELGIGSCIVAAIGFLVFIAAMSTVAKYCCRQCDNKAPAVRYLGWYGSIQTFEFDNPDFAEAFANTNSGKLVGFGRQRRPFTIGYGPAAVVICAACAAGGYFYLNRDRAKPNGQDNSPPSKDASAQNIPKALDKKPDIRERFRETSAGPIALGITVLSFSYNQLEYDRVAREKTENERLEAIRLAKVAAQKEADEIAFKKEAARLAAEAQKARDEVEAQKLYDKVTARIHLLEIVQKYPGTRAAVKAKERLDKLDKK